MKPNTHPPDILIIPYEKSPNREILIDYADLKKALATLNTFRYPICKKILEWMDWMEVHEEKRRITVTEIQTRLQLGRPMASIYLALLKKARLVIAEKEGHYVHISLHKERIAEISRVIEEF